MSISQSLNNALSGLTANARQAELTSNNLANALTDGYGVRSLNLSSQTLGDKGSGVRIEGTSRQVDKGILAERRGADAERGAFSTTADALSELERIVGGPNDGSSLANRIIGVETALIAASGDPSSELRLSQVARAMDDMTESFNTAQDDIQAMRVASDRSIASQIDTLNTALIRIEDLNTTIQQSRARGAETSGLEDQRQLAIDSIAEIVPVRLLDRENGRVAVMTMAGEMLIDGPAVSYGFTHTPVIMPHMTQSAGMLGGISRDGIPLSGGGFRGLQGGSLEANFKLRDRDLVEAQTKLDAIARDLIERVQDTSVDPSRAATTPALLTDNGAIFATTNEVGLAGRIAFNTTVDPENGGDVRAIRDGISAPVGPVGDSAQLNRWLDGWQSQTSLATGTDRGSPAEHAARFAAAIGADRLNAEEQSAFVTARWSALREAELAGGVDSDHEMQMLLRIEQAYAANAKVIETVQFMMRELMEL